jgi:hypothetical protein
MGLVALAQAEGAREVAGKELDLLDAGNQGLVDGLLVGSTAAGNLLLLCVVNNVSQSLSVQLCSHAEAGNSYLGLLSLLEESLLAGLLLGLVGGEVLGLGDLLNLLLVETGDIDLVGGGDDVAGVDSSERDAVDLEGAGDEEDTLVEGLDENDTLAAEATGKKNQDGTGLEGLAGSPGADSLADL